MRKAIRAEADLDVDIGSTPRGRRARWTAVMIAGVATVGAGVLWVLGWEVGAVLVTLLLLPPCLVIALKR